MSLCRRLCVEGVFARDMMEAFGVQDLPTVRDEEQPRETLENNPKLNHRRGLTEIPHRWLRNQRMCAGGEIQSRRALAESRCYAGGIATRDKIIPRNSGPLAVP